MSQRLLRHFAVEYPLEYMDSTETLITACRLGYDVREVPVEMHPRAAGQPSNRSFRLVYNYARLLVVLVTSARSSTTLPSIPVLPAAEATGR